VTDGARTAWDMLTRALPIAAGAIAANAALHHVPRCCRPASLPNPLVAVHQQALPRRRSSWIIEMKLAGSKLHDCMHALPSTAVQPLNL
jgi:hypothetical protein